MLQNATPLRKSPPWSPQMPQVCHCFWNCCDVEKVNAVVARSTFPSQNVQSTPALEHFWKLRRRKSARRCGAKHISKSKCQKTPHARTTFEGSDVVLRGRREGSCTLPKVSNFQKRWGDLERWMSRGRRSTRDMFIRDVRRSGCWFPERGCILEQQIFRFAKTDAALCMTWHHFFRARRSTLDRWSGKNTKRIGTRPSALQLTFQFWKTSRRIASLWMSTSKIEVSQNYCVFDAVKFESWGNLRIAAFLMLSSSRSLAEYLCFPVCRQTDR